MPDTPSTLPAAPTHSLTQAWIALRRAAVASFVFQIAGSVELVLSGVPAERVGNALFSAGWLTLVGIVTYGITLRARWALWLAGGYSWLAIVTILLTQIIPRISTVQVAGMVVADITPASTIIDLFSLLASIYFIYGLVRLRKAKRS